MNEKQFTSAVSQEISDTVAGVAQEQLAALVEAILQVKRVFVCGAGRSLLMMKAFAMRLMHLGIEAYVVGETITPAITNGDLLIAASGSGQTRVTLATVEAAAARGADTAIITAHSGSPIAGTSDLVVEVPAPVTGTPRPSGSRQIPGTLFEQCVLVIGDGLVLELMERLGTSVAEMSARHTKLE
jgi:6-phospho-3-hexuloisomerase